MLKNFLLRSFEQNQDTHLPFTVQRMVRGVADGLGQNATGSTIENQRQIEFAHVTLHMRLYQRFGTKSNQTIDLAHAYLDQLLSASIMSSTPAEQFRPAV